MRPAMESDPDSLKLSPTTFSSSSLNNWKKIKSLFYNLTFLLQRYFSPNQMYTCLLNQARVNIEELKIEYLNLNHCLQKHGGLLQTFGLQKVVQFKINFLFYVNPWNEVCHCDLNVFFILCCSWLLQLFSSSPFPWHLLQCPLDAYFSDHPETKHYFR